MFCYQQRALSLCYIYIYIYTISLVTFRSMVSDVLFVFTIFDLDFNLFAWVVFLLSFRTRNLHVRSITRVIATVCCQKTKRVTHFKKFDTLHFLFDQSHFNIHKDWVHIFVICERHTTVRVHRCGGEEL